MTIDRQQLAYVLFIGLLILIIIPILKKKASSKSDPSMSLYDSFMLSFFGKAPKKSSTTVKKSQSKTQRNGTKSDLYVTANTILSVAKKKNYFVIMPAHLINDNIELNLSGIVITHSTIIGFHCFGFGGTITKNEAVWSQYINGESRQLDSISKICSDELEKLNEFLNSIDIHDLPTKIVAVFTTPKVIIPNDKLCYTKDSFSSLLMSISNQEGNIASAKELGKKLSTYKPRS